MKFEIGAKVLKNMLKKATVINNKKVKYGNIIYIKSDSNKNILEIYTCELSEHYLKITIEDVNIYEDGIIGIHLNDIKTLTKLKDDAWIRIEYDCNNDNEIMIKIENKITKIINCYDREDFNSEFPSALRNDDLKGYNLILEVDNLWLYNVITDCIPFIIKKSNENYMCDYFYLDNSCGKMMLLSDNRQVLIRKDIKYVDNKIVNETDNIKLHKRCCPVLKNIIDKKDSYGVKFYKNKNNVIIIGKNFKYFTKFDNVNLDGLNNVYKNTSFNEGCIVNLDSNNLIDVLKYNLDLDAKTIMIHVGYEKNRKLYTLSCADRCKIFDSIEIDSIFNNYELYIEFDINNILKALNMLKCDIKITMKDKKDIALVTGKDYEILICPVFLPDSFNKSVEIMKECINEQR